MGLILSDNQQNSFNDEGFILPQKKLFSDSKYAELTNIFEELLASKGNEKGNELDVPHFSDKRLFDFLMADEVLDVVEDLIGPNIGLWSSHFICKEPFSGERTPWHEDSAYWEGRFDRYDDILTIWLAIDRSTKENGCMGVIPGTHKNGFSHYKKLSTDNEIFQKEIDEDALELNKVIWFELEKNHYSIHDSRIIHGANANNSSMRRTGFTMRYFNTELKFVEDHKDNLTHRIYNCRGNNPGNNPLIHL